MGPLNGVKVLDFTHFLAGPFCTMLLGDMDAEVIKVEMPGVGDSARWDREPKLTGGESYHSFILNRNKKSVTLDLKDREGREIALKLAKDSDVLVENFRPGVMERLGLGFEVVSKLNPRLIYCSISSYGLNGPYSQRPGYDAIVQAESGIMTCIGIEGWPPIKAFPGVMDISAGILSTCAISTALFAREATGMGEKIDVSLFDTAIFYLGLYTIPMYFGLGQDLVPLGSAHPTLTPYEAYRTKDDRWIMVAAPSQKFWEILCSVLGMEELKEDPRFLDNPLRIRNREALRPILEEAFFKRTRNEWLKALDEVDIPHAPVNTTSEALKHPQIEVRKMLVEMTHQAAGRVKVLGNPIKLFKHPLSIRQPSPILGQHTKEVLHKLGYSKEEIQRLRKRGVI